MMIDELIQITWTVTRNISKIDFFLSKKVKLCNKYTDLYFYVRISTWTMNFITTHEIIHIENIRNFKLPADHRLRSIYHPEKEAASKFDITIK